MKTEPKDDKFYFEEIGVNAWQVRQGKKRIGIMIKAESKKWFRPKSDRHKTPIWFKSREECAKTLLKINEAKKIYKP